MSIFFIDHLLSKDFRGAKNAPGRINGQRTPAESGAPPSFCEIDGWRPRVPYAGFLVLDVTGFQDSLRRRTAEFARTRNPSCRVPCRSVSAGKKSSRYIHVTRKPQNAHSFENFTFSRSQRGHSPGFSFLSVHGYTNSGVLAKGTAPPDRKPRKTAINGDSGRAFPTESPRKIQLVIHPAYSAMG